MAGNGKRFTEELNERNLLFDGAMGTLLYSRGIYINRNFDEMNVSRPDMVEKVHFDYIAAGADVIQTNTFGANRVKLGRFGLEDKVVEINRAGAKIAKKASGGKAFVAGSIGPTGLIPDIYHIEEMQKLGDVFREQARALVDAGVDLIVLETFRHPAEIKAAVEGIKSSIDVCLMAQMAFDEEEKTADGMSPERIAHLLKEWGADIIGANCGVGPSTLYPVAEKMLSAGLPVSIQPNAGHPKILEGRVMYMSTPEYFGEFAKRFLNIGVKILGGCCGTTPDHIRQVSAEVRMKSGGKIRIKERAETIEPSVKRPEAVPLEDRSLLGKILGRKFIVSVEIDPPAGLGIDSAIKGAKLLKDGGVEFINIADGPRATARVSNIALASLIQKETGVETITHVTCRDRNLLGIQADLLGAHSLGLKNLLIITGDPSKLGDYPDATTVYDLDSIGLLKMASQLNLGIDPAGKPFKGQTSFVIGCGVEPGAHDMKRELDRLRKKIEAGAKFIMTQPVFDIGLLKRVIDYIEGMDVVVLAGILPLASYKNAEFLHNEVPGMQIPEKIRERMRLAGSGQAARDEGIKIARES
ncbi:MAG: bifunctional homocysteine S-methyltransferase/methylenetetrahydrofolate reductase, partial [Deltaproteobacteria bacterium]|nr:bifunctional homocysteine S-methyltransferase/methylenetetrahydrofolate reductase [Deltaproteobacteria bacterium]